MLRSVRLMCCNSAWIVQIVHTGLALKFIKKQCYCHESSLQPINILVGEHDVCIL
jgi:hypothetical protein